MDGWNKRVSTVLAVVGNAFKDVAVKLVCENCIAIIM